MSTFLSSKFGLGRRYAAMHSDGQWLQSQLVTDMLKVYMMYAYRDGFKTQAVPRPYTTLVGFFKECATSKCQLPEAGTTLATLLIHNINWHIAPCMYSPWANILSHRTTHVQPMGQYTGISHHTCTAHGPIYWHIAPHMCSPWANILVLCVSSTFSF